MCFTKRREQSKIAKQKFQQIYALRQKYTQTHQLSQFLMCTLTFMEETIKSKGLNRHYSFVLFNSNYHHNVHANFEKTFYSLSHKQQVFYYGHIINTLVQNKKVDMQLLNRPQMDFQFDIEIQKLMFRKITKVKVEASRFLLIADPVEYDLRNFWFRRSKKIQGCATWVLSSIVQTSIPDLRFRIDEPNQQQYKKIIDKMNKIRIQSVIKVVRQWLLPIKKVQQKIAKVEAPQQKNQTSENMMKSRTESQTYRYRIGKISESSIQNKNTHFIKKQPSIINHKQILEDSNLQQKQKKQSQNRHHINKKEIPLTDLLEITDYKYLNNQNVNQSQFKSAMSQKSQLSLSKFGNVQYVSTSSDNRLQDTQFYTMKEDSLQIGS